jgi:hypothetical protein
VAHPSPYSPGSLVSTFTTTRLDPEPPGLVAMALTLVIFKGGNPAVAWLYFADEAPWAIDFSAKPKVPIVPPANPNPKFLITFLLFIRAVDYKIYTRV